ncbi:GFA family protein [Dongia soli]|uniref:GFA family protein n=1 Tax=Dongia soli TaxID=600628 RepID=A0ABU5EAB2_9PROT|nr:GFA family protein [Dongia soli]MDY0882930.1 GFA family protein [Dongia soli]
MSSIPATALADIQPNDRHASGECLCGAVRYEIQGILSPPSACHCGMCRRHHGALGVFTGAPVTAFRIHGADHVGWYRSSPEAERGFCRQCGSKLFWRQIDSDRLDVTMGSLHQPSGLHLDHHIWVAHRGDYYDIADALPKYAESAVGHGDQSQLSGHRPAPVPTVHEGGCLCGAIRFKVDGDMRNVVVCHCGQCRHWHGHSADYSAARTAEMALRGEGALSWYASSPGAQRGFCRHCGTSLFWRGAKNGTAASKISISAGALDGPTGLQTVRHIFVADLPDYYAISGDAERDAGSMASNPVAF